ncbi:MAG: response regulator [Candidatus Sericytochromatia bacterium]
MAKATILIVEDESIVAEDIRFSLEANGYEVCGVFSNGEDALRQVGRLQPDLILLDIRLDGELDGIETARRIWDEYQIPIVYLTAHSDEATLERAKGTRPFAYLLKPFEERELCVTVEIALSKRPAAPLLELPYSDWYDGCQRILAAAAFAAGTARLARSNGASAELRVAPAYDLLATMDDRSVDILDIVALIWLQQAQAADSLVSVRAEDCLAFRGLKQQKSGSGARGGYEDKWKKDVANQIDLLTRISLQEQGASGPLLLAEPGENEYSWRLRPGDWLSGAVFGQQRRSVLFSRRILEYDPYRQKWEKRLARQLCWQWAAANTPALVKLGKLLAELQLQIDSKNPIRTKERLEMALETLKRDSVIGRWEYLNQDVEIVGKRGWLALWMDWQLRIEPPLALREQYAGVAPAAQARPVAAADKQSSFAFLKHIRAERGLSQMEVASQIGLTQAQLSRIEAGGKVHAATAEKIKHWIVEAL